MVVREGKKVMVKEVTVEAQGRRKKSPPKKEKVEEVKVEEVKVEEEKAEEVRVEEVRVEEVKGEVKGDVEEKESDGKKDSYTQTSGRTRKRGRESRMRRLLSYQLLLTERRGFPLSRLLTNLKRAEARSQGLEGRRMEEESASPVLKRRGRQEEIGVEVGGVESGEVRGEVRGLEEGEVGGEARREEGDTNTGDQARNTLKNTAQLVFPVGVNSPPTIATTTTTTTTTTTPATKPSPSLTISPTATPQFLYPTPPYPPTFTPIPPAFFPLPTSLCSPTPGLRWVLSGWCSSCGSNLLVPPY